MENVQRKLVFCSFRFQHLVYLVFCAFILLSCVMHSFHRTDQTIHHIPLSSSPLPTAEMNTREKVVFWSTDFHISPIADIKSFLERHFAGQVQIIDKSLSGHCHLTKTCQKDLRVLDQQNGLTLSPCPNELRREFFEYYSRDEEFQSADVILCTHAISLCELYMPFNKPLIAIASTRYEIGRYEDYRWKVWNQNLERIASKEYNTIAANNLYDLEYMKYFTNLKKVGYLPNLCKYVEAKYYPKRKEILLAPARGIQPAIRDEFFQHLQQYNNEVRTVSKKAKNIAKRPIELGISAIRDLYPNFYEYSDLAQHPAIIILPYQVSFMSFFEFYQMEIPMYVPAPSLLAEWHYRYQMLSERTWHYVFKKQVRDRSYITRANQSCTNLTADPNNDASYEAILEWIRLSDFYSFPHVQQFTSWADLFQQLKFNNRDQYWNISKQMAVHNERLEKEQLRKWHDIIENIRKYKLDFRKLGGQKDFIELLVGENGRKYIDVNTSLKRSYGYELSMTDCFTEINSDEEATVR